MILVQNILNYILYRIIMLYMVSVQNTVLEKWLVNLHNKML